MKRYIKSARSSSAYSPRGASATREESDREFSELQQEQIQLGEQAGVDVSIYADPQYSSWQMEEIREGLEEGLDVSIYADPKYKWDQMNEIHEGLTAGVDVSLYADPKYKWGQMEEIRKGLESGVDINIYADPSYTEWQMKEIREGIKSGVDVSVYANLKYDSRQMGEIREGLEEGLDVNIYADPSYDPWQMRAIRKGLESGVDVSVYADPQYDDLQMRYIREGLIKYANDPDILTATPEQIATAYKKNAPNLAYMNMSNYEKAKDRWSAIKQAAQSRQPLDVPALEEEFNLVPLEGRAASTLNITFDENSDGSVTFTTINGGDLGTLSAQEYDLMVKAAIANSSTRSSFAKAFATQLKHTLGL